MLAYGRMKPAALLLMLAAVLGGCSHVSIKRVGDCDKVAAEQRIACAACTVKNEAKGWIGEWEYRPDDSADRCVRVK